MLIECAEGLLRYKKEHLRNQMEQAMETNYSHEMMNPLNGLINITKKMHQKVDESLKT